MALLLSYLDNYGMVQLAGSLTMRLIGIICSHNAIFSPLVVNTRILIEHVWVQYVLIVLFFERVNSPVYKPG